MARLDLGGNGFSHQAIATTISRKIQELIILPTERCNFRCTYCYEDFAIGKMKPVVQESIKRFMDRRIPELNFLLISWFGGEPLLAKDVVLSLSRYALNLSKQYDVSFQGAMTTNGYVLNFALFEELLHCNQREYQITLDGWMGGHDIVRSQANGRGTFERIWENLLATRRSSEIFKITIRVHVRRDNYDSLVELIRNLGINFGNDDRYLIDFQHVRDLGGEGGKTVLNPISLTELNGIEGDLRSRYDAYRKLTAQNHDSVDSTNVSSPYICYASKPNSLLIRADGRIGKCTVALDDIRNTIGSVNVDGTLTIDNKRLQPWIRGLVDLNPGALECPLVDLSAGS